MEIKYNMRKGAGLTYSWTASATLFYEFHGEPDVKPAGKAGTDYYESYDLDDKKGKSKSSGFQGEQKGQNNDKAAGKKKGKKDDDDDDEKGKKKGKKDDDDEKESKQRKKSEK